MFYQRGVRKGQITLFVLLGIVIVVLAGLGYYTYNRFTEQQATQLQQAQDVTDDLKPIQNYIHSCMLSIGTEAIILLGEHGGYIDPTNPVLTGDSFNLNPYQQYRSDAAFFSTEPTTGVAYWYYSTPATDCENCLITSKAPTLQDMEFQIEQYILEHLESCLENFTTFTAQGFQISDARNYTIQVRITDAGVAFSMADQISVVKQNDRSELTQFYITSDIPLKKYYDMAVVITLKEIETNYLENLALYLIGTYSGLDTNKLPPPREYGDSEEIFFWSKTQTRNTFENLLQSYVPMITVPHTRNYREPPKNFGTASETVSLGAVESYLYRAMVLDFFNNQSILKTDINFIYLGQPIYLDITPSEGDIVGPESDDPLKVISLFEPREYNSYLSRYDISYPVIVEIRDEYASGQEYSFFFAMEANIRDTMSINDWYNASKGPIYWNPDVVHGQLTDPQVQPEATVLTGLPLSFRELYSTQSVNTADRQETNTIPEPLFCNADQRVAGPIQLRTYDENTGRPLDGVKVTFSCGNYLSCNMGKTVLNRSVNSASFLSNVPLCLNGFIQLDKQGYLQKRVPISSEPGRIIDTGSVSLQPLVEKTVRIEKFYIDRTVVTVSGNPIVSGRTLSATPQSLDSSESVILTFTKLSNSELEDEFTQTVVLGKDALMSELSTLAPGEGTVLLVPGRYTLTAQLIDYSGYVIPEKCKSVCVDDSALQVVTGCQKHKRIPDQAINVSVSAMEAAVFNESNTIVISRDGLLSNATLIVPVIDVRPPRCFDDLQEQSLIARFDTLYRSRLIPRFG